MASVDQIASITLCATNAETQQKIESDPLTNPALPAEASLILPADAAEGEWFLSVEMQVQGKYTGGDRTDCYEAIAPVAFPGGEAGVGRACPDGE